MTQLSLTDNKIFRLYSIHGNTQTLHKQLLQQQGFIQQDNTLNTIMFEIARQIKSNAAWTEKRNSVFLILFYF